MTLLVIDSFKGEHRFLSNFQAASVEYEGVLYPTVENAYMAAKTTDKALREPFTRISAVEAKRLGKVIPLRPGWDSLKIGIMCELVRQKFRIPLLRYMLLATGYAHLEEGNTWGDTFWGTCNGYGRNMLGEILMQIREEIREVV